MNNNYGLIGDSPEIKSIRAVIKQVASSDISVLIYGESGSGKEVVARAIHENSPRKDHRLVSINCAAIPEGIFESELFGHKKGSFTNATENRKGYFELADGGTMFLDEIADMPLLMQVKLLRAIEYQEYMPVGSETVQKTDIRIIAATNKNLESEVEKNRFREDFYFRLKSVIIHIPPLRKRKGDVPLLVSHFVSEYEQKNSGRAFHVSEEALQRLINYHWPGNVRELRNVIRTAMAMTRENELSAASFDNLLSPAPQTQTVNKYLPVSTGKTPDELEHDFLLRALFEIKKDIIKTQAMIEELKAGQEKEKTIKDAVFDEELNLREIEKKVIAKALSAGKGNKRKAAKLLGISPRTLYRKLDEYFPDGAD